MFEFCEVEELLNQTETKAYQGDYVCSYYGKFATTAKREGLEILNKFIESWG